MTETDGPDVRRCWEAGEHDTLEELSSEIEKNKLNTLVIQFNYGFFQFERFASFLDRQISAGRTVVLVMHATSDPEHAPHKILANLAPVLQRCDRLLVHSVADLNRLKALGLVSNVALFPHGILDYPSHSSSVTRSSQREYLIASYGFFLPHKGLPELIEAVAQLRSRGHFVRFRMVNAEYPVGESRILIEDCKSLIIRLGLQNSIEMVTDYLTDAESFKLLSDADLIVFPYQHTAESASGAVRYGLATGRPVAVTPLAIFDDVSMAVHRLPGHGPDKIASGIQDLLDQISASSPSVNETSKHAARWRDAHRYSNLTTRLDGILRALVQQRINQGSDTGRLSH
jgi:O-antigen biosynthesis alpha-1,2-mannosyltransferase